CEQTGCVPRPPAYSGPRWRSSSAEPDRWHARRAAWRGRFQTPRSLALTTLKGTRKSSLPGRNSGQRPSGSPVTSIRLATPPAAGTAYSTESVFTRANRSVPLSLQLPPTIVATSFAIISGAPSGTRIFFRLVPSENTNDRESGDQNPGFLKLPVRTGSGVSLFNWRNCTPFP